jgi:AraC family transcriptional regulator
MRHHIIAGVFRGEGTTALKVEGRQLRVSSETGTVIINPKETDGWWTCAGSPLVSNVFLGEERLERCSDEAGRGARPELPLSLQLHDIRLFGILALIAEESAVEDAVSTLYMEHLVDALCLHRLRKHVTSPIPEARFRGGLSPSQVRRVVDYMKVHLSEDIRLQTLADLVGRSRFHFCREFRRTTGLTPHEALMRLRIRRACELLADPKLSVTEVGLDVGYQRPSSFAQAFRAVVGVTPSSYRKVL